MCALKKRISWGACVPGVNEGYISHFPIGKRNKWINLILLIMHCITQCAGTCD